VDNGPAVVLNQQQLERGRNELDNYRIRAESIAQHNRHLEAMWMNQAPLEQLSYMEGKHRESYAKSKRFLERLEWMDERVREQHVEVMKEMPNTYRIHSKKIRDGWIYGWKREIWVLFFRNEGIGKANGGEAQGPFVCAITNQKGRSGSIVESTPHGIVRSLVHR
jgi:hypothetical protein